MSEIYYTTDHEWLAVDGDTVTIGITDHAQAALGEIVYVDLPESGKQFDKGEVFAVVESVKAASDVYAPIKGEVLASNESLADAPELINDEPESEGWFVKMQLSEPLSHDAYMNKAAYLASLDDE